MDTRPFCMFIVHTMLKRPAHCTALVGPLKNSGTQGLCSPLQGRSRLSKDPGFLLPPPLGQHRSGFPSILREEEKCMSHAWWPCGQLCPGSRQGNCPTLGLSACFCSFLSTRLSCWAEGQRCLCIGAIGTAVLPGPYPSGAGSRAALTAGFTPQGPTQFRFGQVASG